MQKLRKGILYYEYIDSQKRYNRKSLSPKENFCGKLKNKGISGKNCRHAQTAWGKLKIKNLDKTKKVLALRMLIFPVGDLNLLKINE